MPVKQERIKQFLDATLKGFQDTLERQQKVDEDMNAIIADMQTWDSVPDDI